MIFEGSFSSDLHKNVCCGYFNIRVTWYTLESPQQHMLWVLIRITSPKHILWVLIRITSHMLLVFIRIASPKHMLWVLIRTASHMLLVLIRIASPKHMLWVLIRIASENCLIKTCCGYSLESPQFGPDDTLAFYRTH